LDPFKLVFVIKDILDKGSPVQKIPETGGQIQSGGNLQSNNSGSCCDSIYQLLAELRSGYSGKLIAAPSASPIVNSGDCKFVLDKPMDVKLDDEQRTETYSIWGIFIAGFIGGLIALLTPCVFPMIPMTVSFFTKRSIDRKSGIRNALIYALSIITIYVSLGMLITIIFDSSALNEMSSNVWFNLLFFFVFIIFAFSFFGAFEIVIPSGLINKVDRASDRGGILGIIFMAFTLSLVSFSCTGPIIGTLLVETASGKNYLGPAIGMLGFSVALAFPFALFALFPSWLNSLPKSGGWLNAVKVTLGFVELALALKFLSTVDLAYHWGFLKREIFLSLWIIISFLTGLYLLGKLKFAHDSDTNHIGVPRLLFAILALSFGAYMIPGLWGAPTSLISGYLPPSYYKEWRDHKSDDCPNDLMCFHDFEEGMCYAKKVGKPVMIDFTGYACVNCRRMEDNVWIKKEIFDLINNDYVLISLYVDDKKALPTDKVYTNPSGKKIDSYGALWGEMEKTYFSQNSQPLYVLLDNKGKILAQPTGYTPEVSEYEFFLQKGLRRYKERKVAEQVNLQNSN
jgi:thiol:disulfide interchange protein DsbD